MKLKRLILQGFKSFRDKTIINFEHGITGIVGPNGCGKSNIVDALFWVMGEQSAKHLRGNSMQDVIFAGSAKYTPGSWAEVTLVLENTKGKHIHINSTIVNPSEIQLTRKLYRNGETEYRINNQICRLKDIQEVFMDTGAGAKSYSIIAQGEINKLVQAKPEERRSMIEDVAGITKFKNRKKESLKKIEQTESNLARLSDLQEEISKNLKTLEKQAEKAEKARTIRDRIRKVELSVNAHKEFDLLNDYREGQKVLGDKKQKIEECQVQKNILETQLEEDKTKRADMVDKLDIYQADFNQMAKELATTEERFQANKRSIKEKLNQVEQRQREGEQLAEEIKERKNYELNLKRQWDELQDGPKDEEDLSLLEEKVDILKSDFEIKQDVLTQLQKRIFQLKDELVKADQAIFQNSSKAEEYARGLHDMAQEIELLEKQYSSVSQEMIQLRDDVKNGESNLQKLTADFQQASEEEKSKQLEVRDIAGKYQTIEKEVFYLEAKLNSLQELALSLENLENGSKKFLESDLAQDSSFTLLGQVVRCDEEYTKAVEVLLWQHFENLVCIDEDLEKAITWSGQEQSGRLEIMWPFLSMGESEEQIKALELAGFTKILPLADIIQIENETLLDGLKRTLSGLFLVEGNPESAELLRKIWPEGLNAIVTYDGAFSVKRELGGLLTSFGLKNKTESVAGPIERNNQIAFLKEKIAEKKMDLAKLSEHKLKVENELDLITKKLAEVRQIYDEGKIQFQSKKIHLEAKQQSYEVELSRLSILKKRHSEYSSSKLTLLELEDGLQTKRNNLNNELEEKQSEVEIVSEQFEMLGEQYNSAKEELSQKKALIKNFEFRFKSLEDQLFDISSQIGKIESKIKTNLEIVQTLENEVEGLELTNKDLEENNFGKVDELKDKEAFLNQLKEELTILLNEMQVKESELKKVQSELTQSEKAVVEGELRIEQIINEEEQIVKNVFEKYQVDIRECLGKFLEFSPMDYIGLKDISILFTMEGEHGPVAIAKSEYEFDRKYGKEIKEQQDKLRQLKVEFNHLGEINWQAIEDFERQKARYDFLKTQEEELKKSLTDLQVAISHIDEKSRIRFAEAYEEVNERFKKVFPIIFGGGYAELKLVGDIDSTESGIEIIASPPGKKMQNINLMSGGEKAMTAVALIFSIFLVKPSPFCLLDEVDAPLDDANVGRFGDLLREMGQESQFIVITHNKKTMELNDALYGVTMQEPGISKAVSIQLH